MLFGHLARMDETADTRRILTGVHQSDWSRPVGRPYTSWMATLKSDLSLHHLTFEDAIELALDKSLWRLLVGSKRSYALTQCMPNNDDDDDDDWGELEWCITVCYMYDMQVGLSLLIRRASTMSPAVKLIVQKFVPFPAVGQLVDILPRLLYVIHHVQKKSVQFSCITVTNLNKAL